MDTTMLAGVFLGEGQLDLQERPVPDLPGPDWVRIQVEGCGVCGTDLHILSVPPGHPAVPGVVLGHELIGRVTDVGPDVLEIRPGQRVAVAPNLTCGVCRACKAGRSNHCERWTTIGVHRDGGFARYTVAPERAVHPIAEDLPFADAVWVEPLSCVVNGTDRMGIQPGQTAAIIGAGPIGALHGLIFQAAGARVLIADVAPARLERARQAGLDVTVNVWETDLRQAVLDWTDGQGADVVVDAVGNQFQTAIELAARCGQISLFGMNANARPPVHQYDITRKELTVYGTYVGAHTFPRAIQILECGAIRPSLLTGPVVPLAQIHQGLEAARRGEAMKVVVRP